MRTKFPLLAAVLLPVLTVQAIVDTNDNSLSDLWEKAHNNGNLFPSNFDPLADPDGDGWTNAQEAAAGTDPSDANPPAGHLQPEITYYPAVYYTDPETNVTETQSPAMVTLNWPTLPGKQYALQYSTDLAPGNWSPLDEPRIGTGWDMGSGITLTQPDGSIADRIFWRVAVTDPVPAIDTDSDGLGDYEEYLAGTDPVITDSDGDTLSDYAELIAGTNPNHADEDGDGITDPFEITAGTNSKNQDTDGDAIPDWLDTQPLLSAQVFADADDDGIPDANDPDPNTPRGPKPLIISENASGNPNCELEINESASFILTVSNPSGPAPTSSDFTIYLNGVEETANITALATPPSVTGTQRFNISWLAKVTTSYPTQTLQNISLRFRDSQNATTWLNVARADVAEWEGMIAAVSGGATEYNNSPMICVVSHYRGVKQTAERLDGVGSVWYRGPKEISLLDLLSGSDTGVTARIGTQRYPLFVISTQGSTRVVERTLDVSDPAAYPHHGIFYLNRWSSAVTMSHSPGGAAVVPSGGFLFQPLPPAPESGSSDFGLQGTTFFAGQERLFYSSLWGLQQDHGYFRNFRSISISNQPNTQGEPRPKLSVFGGVFAYIGATITPHNAGTLEYPGLAISHAFFPPAPYADSPYRIPLLPIQSERWHQLVLKVGPDAGALSNGITLKLGTGAEGENDPQTGFTLQTPGTGGFEPLTVPPNGKIEMAPSSALYQKLTSPEGLTLFLKRDSTVTGFHRLGLDLIPKKPSYPVQRIAALDLLPVEVAVDADRDGEITFDQKDKTTAEKPYRFWINDDRDIEGTVDGDDWEEDDIYVHPTANGGRDTDSFNLEVARDLEDLTRVWIDFSGINSVFPARDSSVKLKVRIDSSSAERAGIILYQPVETSGGRQYLKDEGTGYNQLQGDYGNELCRVGISSTEVPRRGWETLGADKVIHFLFEGLNKGDGKLIFELWKDGEKVCDLPAVDLLLKKASEMYETWTVGDVAAPGVSYGSWPASTATQTSGQNLPAPEKPEEKDYVMFVHGWNMESWEKETFASTMFKRMWHQGYKGRFGAYTWPTFHSLPDYFDTSHFDGSEERAWNSAAPLHALTASLAGTFKDSSGKSLVRLYAHSMGNVVASEALRQMKANSSVHTYISAQAALSSHVWDNTTPEMNFFTPATPNVYGYHWQSSPTSKPHQWQPEGRPSYMAPINMPSSTVFINHYNPLDWALSFARWQLNQSLKPDQGYHYDNANPIDPNGLKDQFWESPAQVLSFPNNRFEIFAFAAESRSFATGQQGATGGMFKIVDSVNLNGPGFEFGDKHRGHSAQFRSTIQKRWTYWTKALDDMKTQTP